jgi:predicted enzyme related to lactoylglutathione lyase
LNRFDGATIELRVPDFAAGVAYYSRLFGRGPDFQPHRDFAEWELVPELWFQLAEGDARPAPAVRFRVADVEAERERVAVELEARCSPITRVPALIAFFDFDDPWGNRLGLYQHLFAGEPPMPGGSFRDFGRGD